jgi:hypothetical protein
LRFVQLTLHDRQLFAKDKILRDGGAREYRREDGGSYSGPSGFRGRPVPGALMIILGAALFAVGLKYADAPNNPFWLPGGAWGIWIVAFVLVCQGTVFLLTGEWLL